MGSSEDDFIPVESPSSSKSKPAAKVAVQRTGSQIVSKRKRESDDEDEFYCCNSSDSEVERGGGEKKRVKKKRVIVSQVARRSERIKTVSAPAGRFNKGRRLLKPGHQKNLLEREVNRFLKLERVGTIDLSIRQYYAMRVLKKEKKGVVLPSRSSFFSALKKKREGGKILQRGRPSALSAVEKKQLVLRLADFESKFSNSLTNEVVKQEAGHIVLARLRKEKEAVREEKWKKNKQNLDTVFRPSFVYPFRKMYMSLNKSSRGMEVARARKLQPEICLQWFRLYLHGCALRQLQVWHEVSEDMSELYL
tara:strand:+ start:98 stop:1018 length:921 start_codon:yes stop_codon:yes gene_type:complete